MRMHGIKLDTNRIRDFCRMWKIRELSVFGSILRDDFRADSDIDFLASFEEDERWDLFDEMHMREELAEIVGRKVDLVDKSVIESSPNRFIRRGVLAYVEPVYASRWRLAGHIRSHE